MNSEVILVGLDMYLRSYKKDSGLSVEEMLSIEDLIWEDRQHDVVKEYEKYLTTTRWGHSFFTEVAYWRKANEIHKWFVDNVQDGDDNCGYYEVTKENLETLNALCKQVLEECGENEFCFNSARASELLPTQDGFFFGNTDYDNWYIEDIQDTIIQLEKILKEFDFEHNGLLYHSSW